MSRPYLTVARLALISTILLLSMACSRTPPTNDNEGITGSGSAAERIVEADKLYAGRGDLGKARSAVILGRGARAAEPNNYEAAWRLAMYAQYLGDSSTDDAEKERAFQTGIEAAEAAVKLQPDKPEGHFWLGANLGGKAQLSALEGLSDVDKIRTEMNEVLRIDEKYLSGSAYLALGQIEVQTPAMLGGDAKKGVAYFEKGLKIGATNSLLRLWLAKGYLETERKPEARKMLDSIFTMQPDPNYLPEHEKAVREARELLQKEFQVTVNPLPANTGNPQPVNTNTQSNASAPSNQNVNNNSAAKPK